MADETPLIDSLRAALAHNPDDVPLRLHLAELLLGAGRASEAVVEAATVLQRDPSSEGARELMARAMGAQPPAGAGHAGPSAPGRAPDAAPPAAGTGTGQGTPGPAPGAPSVPAPREGGAPRPEGYDWSRAEEEVADVSPPPRFVSGTGGDAPVPVEGPAEPDAPSAWDVEAAGKVRLSDVGGMQEVKQRLEAAFLAPMRNPELRRMYGKSLRGGLLLYGPPGCGKTFLARAVAGELGASFMNIALSDVLDMWLGKSERNLSDLFDAARRNTPCVVFLDEIDALGGKRSRMNNSSMRNTVNQLLTELDGVDADNEGVFVLAATNHPWDVDSALRRPGRLDRTLLVLPPDGPAREAILRYHLRERPVAGIDLGRLAERTDGFSGADLAHVCETASEHALLDSVRTGKARMIEMRDLLEAAKEVSPSVQSWFATARNVALYGNEGGAYDELLAHLKRRKHL